MTPRTSAPTLLLTVVFASLATAIAAAVWWPIYEHPQFVAVVVQGVLIAAILSATAVTLRWPGWVFALVAFVVFVFAGVPLAVPSRAIDGVLPSVEGIVDLVSGVALGWKQLLTITLPVGDYQALLVPIYLLVMLSMFTGVWIGARERGGEWGMLGPIATAIAGIAFGPANPVWPVPIALSLLAVGLAWHVWRRIRRRRAALRALSGPMQSRRARSAVKSGGARAFVAAGAVLAIAAGVAVVATEALPPATEREVLRQTVERPFDPREYASPLASFRRYLQEDTVDSVQFQVTGLDAGERIRIATLDQYDGVVYSVGSAADGGSSADFVRVPATIDRSALGLPSRQLEVEIVDYEGVWLPSLGRLETVEFAGDDAAALSDELVINLDTDTAAVIGGITSGDSYRITSVATTTLGLSALVTLTPGSSDLPRIDTVPDGLSALLDSWVRGVTQPGEQLTRTLDQLAEVGYISHGLSVDEPPSRSGHGADRISELLTAPQMIGDAEQYAVTAALMARQLGFPARVVFGFAPESDGATETISVRGSDVSAWIEIETAEFGWVAVDPVPAERPIPEEDLDQVEEIARPQSLVPPPTDAVNDHEEQTPPESTREDPESIDPVLAALLAVLQGLGVLLVVAAILLAPFMLVIAAKLRRRRLRRKASEPLDRIQGGWDEFADTALDHGISPPAAATRTEFANQVGSLPSRVLAAVVDRSIFAPESADAEDADHVWSAVDELRASLDQSTTRWGRIRAKVSVRSLGAARWREWRAGRETDS